jgi:hypothetical protein
LNEFAMNKYGQKLDRHPNTGMVFAASTLPDYGGLVALARLLGSRLPFIRLAGWDLCLRRDCGWRCIETSLQGRTIRFAQYAGEPFFAGFTQEVVEYCLRHPRLRSAAVRLH